MTLIKLSLDRAEKLHETLSTISDRAGVNGYLTGMMKDVARCVRVNMATDPESDKGDESALEEILEHIECAENILSQYMNTAIVRSE